MGDDDNEIPASVHTEITILGAMMLDRDSTLEGLTRLVAEDFSLDSHQRIFRAIQAVTNGYDLGEEEAIWMLVRNELERRKELSTVGGIAYVSSLTEGVPRRMNIESYVRILKDKALLRRIMSICHTGGVQASDQSESAVDVATSIISKISEAVEEGQVRTEVFDSPTMAMDAVERLVNNPQPDTAILTGFRPLDDFTNGGIRLGELWIVGASPSRGKTTLARQIVKEVVRRGIPCYVHSGEMTKESWYDVTACLLVGLPAWKIREPLLMNLSEKEALKIGLKELSALPFHISDAGGISLDRLLWNAARAVRQHKIKLFAVDYAQIIRSSAKDPKERVTEVAQRLRVFAKDNDVATILLSQSPRPEGRSINSRPNMFALKESGSLEEAAHTVLLPYRPVDIETGAFTGEDEIIVGKQRWGSIGNIPCQLDGRYLQFVDRQLGTP
jgi:replicative DNA helicase